MRLTVLTVILMIGMAACVPAAQSDSQSGATTVIVVGAPAENAVPGLPDVLEAAMRQQPDCCAFDFHWSAPVRAQERQRDLYDYRAWGSAGRMARNLSAEWAVMIGLNAYERTVTEQADRLYINITAGVRLVVVDDQGQEIARFDSRLLTASRVQAASEPLVHELSDPLLLPLATEALPDVVPAVVSELNWLAGAAGEPVSGSSSE